MGLLNWHPESLSLLRYQTKLDVPLTTAGKSNMNLIGKYQKCIFNWRNFTMAQADQGNKDSRNDKQCAKYW